MKPNRAQELDWSSKIMDNCKTPCNRYSQTLNLDYGMFLVSFRAYRNYDFLIYTPNNPQH